MNALWIDLLNSDWHDYKGGSRHEDRLDQDVWLGNFLASWRPWIKAIPLDPLRRALKEMRTLLRRMAENFRKGRPMAKKDIDVLNTILNRAPILSRLVRNGPAYALLQERARPGLEAVLADIAVSFSETLVSGEPDRVKICRNPDCLWIFYDISKNCSRKWCENATGCGNLMKVRQHRARARAGRRA